MGNAHRKARQGLKRAKKKKEARRLQTLSPFRRAAHGGQLECYRGRSDSGLATVMVLGHLTGGLQVLSGFLIDLWCVGLKDAWGQKQITRSDFEDDMLPAWRNNGETVTRITTEEARKLIAGAIRFSFQNGFRLPEHWDRYAAILGDLRDIANAGLSEFGLDGKLRYVGTHEFLRDRLAKCSPAEFLARPDIEFVMHTAAFDAEDESDEDVDLDEEMDDPETAAEIESAARKIRLAMQRRLEKRCAELGVEPHPRLTDAAMMTMFATASLVSEDGAGSPPSDEEIMDEIESLLDAKPLSEQKELREALSQFTDIAPDMTDDEEEPEST